MPSPSERACERVPSRGLSPRCGMYAGPGCADWNILLHVRARLDGDDTLQVSYPHCAGAARPSAWRMETLAMAYFGLAFWHWPPSAAPFIEALGRQVGSELLTLNGKL